MFLSSKDPQARGRKLASISPEMLRTLVKILENDETEMIDIETCEAIHDVLAAYSLSVEQPMVLVRKHAFYHFVRLLASRSLIVKAALIPK